MTILYLAWRNPGQRWFPVGRLTRDENGWYAFGYTHGALEAEGSGFHPLVAFPDLYEPYVSPELFPVFANRLLSDRRPERDTFVSWLNLPSTEKDPLVLLARSSGRRETDTFEVIPHPERSPQGRFDVQCFVHGLQHRSADAVERAERLQVGESLRVESDPSNPADRLALKAITSDALPTHIGFLPRYLNEDVHRLGLDAVRVAVERVNPNPTPIQFRLLVRLIASWPAGFQPCSGDAYQRLAAADRPLQLRPAG